jgi:2-keto-4-pentenoate hydratase/2-oxohepta-3-ene-1,7-dioic acid hydratase in catechol pathway
MKLLRYGPNGHEMPGLLDDDGHMWLEADGRRFQNGNTHTTVFGVAHLISHLSHYMSLQLGGIISTGTPPGVGMGQRPPIYLSAGNNVQLGIDGLGMQHQRVLAAHLVSNEEIPTSGSASTEVRR